MSRDLADIDRGEGRCQAFRRAAGPGGGTFAPAYRIEGTINETDLFIVSWGGVTLTTADDVQVEPTYQARDTTHGRYGHVRLPGDLPARGSTYVHAGPLAGATWGP